MPSTTINIVKSGGCLFAREIIKIAPTGARQVSTALHFYQNRQLELYASKETKRLTLRQLVRKFRSSFKALLFSRNQVYFGRSMNEERLLKVCALAALNSKAA